MRFIVQCNLYECSVSVEPQDFILFLIIMLRKGSELLKGDREVLLDLDYGGEAQTTDSYGSLQNGSFIPPRCVSAVLLFPVVLQYAFLS